MECVKDKGSNLKAMTITMKYVVNCHNLRLEEPFKGPYFEHVMSKACQYARRNKKVSTRLHKMSIKSTQTYFQKCITWPKKLEKGYQEWTNACIDVGW